MREILFRGKRTDTGAWVEGFYAHTVLSAESPICLADCRMHHVIIASGLMYNVLPETVGQFTGLWDKDGTKIFKGDKVIFAGHIFEISFCGGSFGLYDKDGELFKKLSIANNDHFYSLANLYVECDWDDDTAYDIKVVGNIHEATP